MTAADDYCELCDLPKSQCVHGRPPAPPPVKKAASKAAPTPRKKAATPSRARTTTKAVPRRWTPPDEFRPLIVAVLQRAGGELEADEVFRRLEDEVGDRLRSGDRETTPAGELRWQYAARRARQELINDGLMTKGGRGVWKLTDLGAGD